MAKDVKIETNSPEVEEIPVNYEQLADDYKAQLDTVKKSYDMLTRAYSTVCNENHKYKIMVDVALKTIAIIDTQIALLSTMVEEIQTGGKNE